MKTEDRPVQPTGRAVLVEQSDWVALIEPFADMAYDGHEAEWAKFMADVVNLPIDYVAGVQKAIDGGKWRGKYAPVAWIRKVGQTAALNLIGVQDAPRNRQLVYVGRAVDEEQKRPLTREESLRYNPIRRVPRAEAGCIADIKIPSFLSDYKRHPRDAFSDYSTEKYGPKFKETQHYLDRFGDRLPEKYVLRYDHGVSANWVDSILWFEIGRDVGLTPAGIEVLRLKLQGWTREDLLAAVPDKRSWYQAGWRDVSRKWDAVKKIMLQGEKRKVPVARTPKPRPKAAGALLKSLARAARPADTPHKAPLRSDATGLLI